MTTAPAAPDTANPTPATPATPSTPATPAAPAGGDPNPTPATPATPAAPAAPDGGTPHAPAKDDALPAFAVPEALKDKPWAKDKVKSVDDLWKIAANAQELLGRKSVVPDLAKATPQEVADYQSQMRPADEKAYDMSGGQEGYEPAPMDGDFAKAFLKAGIHPALANPLIAELKGTLLKAQTDAFEPQKFLDIMEQKFGNGYETKTGQIRSLIEGNLSKEEHAELQDIPNKYLATMYKLAANMQKAYGVKESGLGGEHDANSGIAADMGEVRKGLRKQITDLGLKPHTAEEKQTLLDKLSATYAQPAKGAR